MGTEGIIFKAHGAATQGTIKCTVLQAKSAVESAVVERIKTTLSEIDLDNLIKEE